MAMHERQHSEEHGRWLRAQGWARRGFLQVGAPAGLDMTLGELLRQQARAEAKQYESKDGKARVRVVPDARLAGHVVRVRTLGGVTEALLISVGAWPNREEKEPNNDMAAPQAITVNTTIQGAAASEDGHVWVGEAESPSFVRKWPGHPGGVESVAFSHDGHLATADRGKKAAWWDGSGKKVRETGTRPDIGLAMAVADGSPRVIAGDFSGTVRAWNATDGKALGTLDPNPAGTTPESRVASAASSEGSGSRGANAAPSPKP